MQSRHPKEAARATPSHLQRSAPQALLCLGELHQAGRHLGWAGMKRDGLLRMHSRALGLQQARSGDGTVLWDQQGPVRAEPFLLLAAQPLTPLLMDHAGRCRHLSSHLALFVPSVICMLQSSHFRNSEKLPKASYRGCFESLYCQTRRIPWCHKPNCSSCRGAV